MENSEQRRYFSITLYERTKCDATPNTGDVTIAEIETRDELQRVENSSNGIYLFPPFKSGAEKLKQPNEFLAQECSYMYFSRMLYAAMQQI